MQPLGSPSLRTLLCGGGLLLASSACDGGGDEVILGTIPQSSAVSLDFGLGYTLDHGGAGLTDSLIADFDGNGSLEVVHASSLTGELTIGTNVLAGDPSVDPVQVILPGRPPLRLVEGDFDGDGFGGFAAVCTEGSLLPGPGAVSVSEIVFYEVDGAGLFQEQARVEIPGYTVSGASGRLLESGRDQLVLADLGGGLVRVYDFEPETTQPKLVHTIESAPAPPSTEIILPFSIELFDHNGDGLLDVALGTTDLGQVGTVATGRVQVIEQIGPGVFGGPETWTVGMRYPWVESLGDLDGDGLDDLCAYDLEATGNDADPAALRLFASGSGTGSAGELLLAAPELPGGVSDVLATDVDLDGVTDLVVALPQEMGLRVLRGPSFQEGSILGPVHQVRRIHAVAGSAPESILATGIARSVWIPASGKASQPLQSAFGAPAGSNPALVAVRDLTGDGRPDAVIVDAEQREVRYLRGAANFQFEPAGVYQLGQEGVDTPGGFRLADLDGDGDLDLGLAANTASTLSVFENTGVLPLGENGATNSFPAGQRPIDLDFGDLDGDGILDVALTDAGENQLVLLRGVAPFEFEAWSEIPLPAMPVAVLVTDLDGGGLPEIALTASSAGGAEPRLLVFAPTDTGPFPYSLQTFASLSGIGTRVRAGDVNEDGRIDLATGHSNFLTGGVTVLLAGADLTDFDVVELPTGPGSSAFDLLDLNLDGHLDVVTPRSDGTLGLVLGDGTGAFSAGVPAGVLPVTPTAATWLDLADLDGDDRPELLMVSPASPHLWIARNTSQ